MEHISGAELKTVSGQCQGTNGRLSPGLPDHLAVGLAESSSGGMICDLLTKFMFISCSFHVPWHAQDPKSQVGTGAVVGER